MNASDKKYLLISIGAHAALLVLLTVKVYFFPSERPQFIKAVRVDLVALPDKDPEEGPQGVEKPPAETAKKPEPAKPKKEEPVKLPSEKTAKAPKEKKPKEPPKKEEPKEDKATKEKQNEALKRLQALANLKKKMNESKKDGPEGKQYKGNQLNEGNSLTGIEKVQYDKYLSQLNDHIKRNWQLPEWMAQKNLSCSVWIRFDENGNLLEKRVRRSSGDPAFDRQAIEAITASIPFPLPPENLSDSFKVHGIEVRFPE